MEFRPEALALSILALAAMQAAAVEEIVVTAQKREQRLQDVGISVTTLSGEQIRALGYSQTTDIAAQTPALRFNQYHPTLTNVSIRGVSQNDFGDHLEPPVAIYADEAYVSSMGAASAQLFDLERVEVLRGPQGTLFGRNATGGLVHFISRKPSERFEAFSTLDVGEYNLVKLEGAVGGPIAERLSARISGTVNNHDGWLDNRLGRDLHEARQYAARAQLLFDAGGDLEMLLKLHYANNDESGSTFSFQPSTIGADGLGRAIGRDELGTFFNFFGVPFTTCPGCDAFGYKEPDDDPFTISADNPGFFKRDIAGATGRVAWDVGDVTFTSTTDYLSTDKNYMDDTDASPFAVVHIRIGEGLTQRSQELRVNGTAGRARWLAGAYYLNIARDGFTSLVPFDLGPFVGVPACVPPACPPATDPTPLVALLGGQTVSLDTESWALFAHSEYEFLPRWTAVAAVRHTEDEKEIDYTLNDNFGTFQVFNPATAGGAAKPSFSNWSARLQLEWRPTQKWLLYAGYNRGHKAGSFSAPNFGPVDLDLLPHDQEVLTSYEGGFKATLLGGRALLNASAYYYDYSGYQASFYVQVTQIISNLDAEAWGGELELAVTPNEHLDISLGAAFMGSVVHDVGMPNGTLQDRDLPVSPSATVNGMVRYRWPVFRGSLAAQADFNYSDRFCFTVLCHHTEGESSYLVGDLRLTYTDAGERWSVGAFVRNITDEHYRWYALNVSNLGFTTTTFAPPRWLGATVSYRW